MFNGSEIKSVFNEESLSLATSSNSRLFMESAMYLRASKEEPDMAIAQVIEMLNGLQKVDNINAISIEGIKGSGKSTLSSGLENTGLGVRTHLIQPTPILEKLIKPLQTGIYYEMFGSSGNPVDAVVDTLIKSAHIFDNLSRYNSDDSLRIFDRFWLSHMLIEGTLMAERGVPQTQVDLLLSKIVNCYPTISAMFVLSGVDIGECETRMVSLRGESPRDQRAIDIDERFRLGIEDMKRGVGLVPSELDYPIYFIDASKEPGIILEEALNYINRA